MGALFRRPKHLQSRRRTVAEGRRWGSACQIRLIGAEDFEEEPLVRIIKRTVEPGTWFGEAGDAPGGTAIEYFAEGKSLVVIHSTDVQEQIQELLTELRAAKKEQEKK